MILTYLGHSCFKIQDKIGSEGITIITDPFDKTVGFKIPTFDVDIATISHNHHDHNNFKCLNGHPSLVDTAGEYDIKGVVINGIESFHDSENGNKRGENIIYKINIDDITIVHLGDLGHILENKQLEKLAETDILLIPVGGVYTLDAKKAVEVVSQIEPRIVIPMHYKTKESKIEIEGVEKFIKEMGMKPTEEEKLKISKKDLPQEDLELVVMNIK